MPARDPALNGHRRRMAITAVHRTNPPCWLCDASIDLTLDRQTHPLGATTDEVIPRSRGGSTTDPSNLRPAHRCCNSSRSEQPVTEEVRQRCRTTYARHANTITRHPW